MIKIRYADLPGGLHLRAVARGKDTIVYLLPGLTVPQRRAALRRALSSARMGHGPPLSATGLTCAMMADRTRTTVRNAAGAMRVHPAMFVPLIVVLVSAATAYVMLTSVTIKVRSPQAGVPETALVPPFTVAAPPGGRRARSGHPGGPAPGTGTPAPSTGRPAPSPVPSPSPDPTRPGPGSSPGPRPSPDPSPGAPSPLPSPSPTPSGQGSDSGSGSGTGVCVNVGPLGVCLP